MAATYTNMLKHITDYKKFIEQYCAMHPTYEFKPITHMNIMGYKLTLSNDKFIFSGNLKNIVKYILKYKSQSIT